MAGIIEKNDPRHPSHPEYGKVSKEREKLLSKQAADKAAVEKLAADKKASEEKKGS